MWNYKYYKGGGLLCCSDSSWWNCDLYWRRLPRSLFVTKYTRVSERHTWDVSVHLYFFKNNVELTVLQLSLRLCTSSITMKTHFSTPSALREHSSFTFFMPWIHSPVSEWLFFFFFGESRVGNSLCLLTLLPARKNNTFPATWVSFYSHWNPPKYISRYWLQLWTEPDIWLVRAPECGQRVSHSNHSALC